MLQCFNLRSVTQGYTTISAEIYNLLLKQLCPETREAQKDFVIASPKESFVISFFLINSSVNNAKFARPDILTISLSAERLYRFVVCSPRATPFIKTLQTRYWIPKRLSSAIV